MEPRFGQDFSRVRIHDDSNAGHIANQLDAQAFTVGRDIFFSQGSFQPHSNRGRFLLAHELTHTLQQRAIGAPEALQRKGEAKKKRAMIITTTDAVVGKEPALNAAADVHQVRSVDELKNLLTTIDHPITTLYINSEATSDAILIGGAYKNVIDLAGEIAGSLPIHSAPKLLDMRSCNLGTNPGAMNSLRDALGARQVMGGTCFLVQLPIKPMIVEELDDQGNWIRDIEVTNKSQFGGKKWLKNAFDDAFQQHLTDIDTGRDLVPCIVGSKGTLEGAKSAYFKNKGWLMEAYYTPSTTGDRSNSRFRCFDEARAGGKVYKANNLPALANYSADPCQTITVKKK